MIVRELQFPLISYFRSFLFSRQDPYDLQQLKLVGNTGKRPFPVVRHIYVVYGNRDEIGGRDFLIGIVVRTGGQITVLILMMCYSFG